MPPNPLPLDLDRLVNDQTELYQATGPALEGTASTQADPPLDCDLAMANLFEFIDAELDIHELEEMRGHIDDCPECLYEEALGRKLKGVIQRTCVEQAPQALRAKVVARLEELRQTPSQAG